MFLKNIWGNIPNSVSATGTPTGKRHGNGFITRLTIVGLVGICLIALGALVACPTEEDESSDASLQSLTLNAGSNAISLTPAFASAELTYTASVVSTVATVTVAATETDGAATVSITPEDADTATNGHQVSLEVGDTVITIVVTAEDDSTTRTYTITVNRAAVGASSDASLSALTLSDGTLSPTFASAELTYTATVSNSVESVTVTATPTDTGASTAIMPADTDTDTDGHQVSLPVGDIEITITVTAADNSTMEDYMITVTRSTSTAMVTVTAPSVMEGNTGMTNLVLMVSADRTVTGGIMVTLTPGTATGNATARESADFSVSEQTITLTDTTEQSVTIGTVTGDTDEEGDATIPISVTISTTPAGQAVAAQGSVELLIIDDDYSGTLTVGAFATATIAEGEETTFTIALNNLPIADLTIPFTVTGGAEAEDYDLTSGDTTMLTVGDGILTILIAGYSAGTEVSLTFAASDDEIVEGAETATIDFPDTFGGNAVVGSDPAITISASDGTATVTVTAPASLMEGDSDDTNIELGVSADKVVEGGIMVTLTPGTATGNAGAIESADFSVSEQTITLTDRAGQTVVMGTVAGDSLLEGDATIPVEVTLVTDPTGLATVAPMPVDVVITDDDQPTASLSISDGVAREAETNPGVFTLTLTKVDQALGDATVSYALAGSATFGAANDYGVTAGGDATAKSLTVASGAGADFVIPAAALSDGTASATITITPTDDSDNDNDERVELTIASIAFATSTETITTVGGSPQTISIDDNNGPTATISVSESSVMEEDVDSSITITFAVSNIPDPVILTPINFSYSIGGTASGDSDYESGLSGSSIFFISRDTDMTSRDSDINFFDDFDVEGNETVVITVTSALQGSQSYDVNGSPATITIIDNDDPDQPHVTMRNGEDPFNISFATEVNITARYQAVMRLRFAPASDATVAYTIATDDTHSDGFSDATLGEDYTIGLSGDATATLTEAMSSFVIPASALSDGAADVMITVTVIDDTEMEADPEVIRLTIDSVSFADGSTPAIIYQDFSPNTYRLNDGLAIFSNE